MGVDGNFLDREMHYWVEAGRGGGELTQAQEAKPDCAEGRPEHGIVKVGEARRKANKKHQILSDGKTSETGHV